MSGQALLTMVNLAPTDAARTSQQGGVPGPPRDQVGSDRRDQPLVGLQPIGDDAPPGGLAEAVAPGARGRGQIVRDEDAPDVDQDGGHRPFQPVGSR
jgi:hypothetical protein